MKKKFETNIAAAMPKTRLNEPELPWKISNEDLEELESKETEYKSAIVGAPPLKTRPIFLIALVLAIFAFTAFVISNIIVENENMRLGMRDREKKLSHLETDLEKISGKNAVLSENASQLKKQVNDLNSQKELFTTVIETLTKKNDEI